MNSRTLSSLLISVSAVAAALVLAGCSDLGKSSAVLDHLTNDVGGPVAPAVDPGKVEDPPSTEAPRCDSGLNYQGFGGTRLEIGRDDEDMGWDRDRVKPYSALIGEYARVLGTTPALLLTLGSTYGATPPRWFIEPEANAISIYSSVRVAFVGCLSLTATGAEYAAAPNLASANENCQKFARRFWSRSAAQDELDGCVKVAVGGTGAEPDARRKWAYTCASVLSSAPFLTY
jgi:hypothetical protein